VAHCWEGAPMKRWVWRSVLILVAVGLGVWLWGILFPSPDRVIRKRLAELAQAVSFRGHESPVATLANSSGVAGFFTRDVELKLEVPGTSAQTISGRDEIFAITQRVRLLLGSLEVKFLDINLVIAGDKKSAEANLTLQAKVAGERDQIVQELKLLLNKVEGSWKIQRVETVKTLSRMERHNHVLISSGE
jgi:hypothetical protein